MNNGSWLPDEDFKGLTDNFFDDLIDHIDFPLEDIETATDEGDWDAAGFQDLVPPPLDVLTGFSSEFIVGNGQRVQKQLSSWKVSSTVADVKVSKLFQSSSPVSVLENINNGSASSQNPNRAQRLVALPVKGIRSKRKPATRLRFRFFKSFVSAMFQQLGRDDETETETYFTSENCYTKKNKSIPTHSVSYYPEEEPFKQYGIIRKCTHCETAKTPQWREGPCGPKTLCNACGVRFRSGRLVPEYRPASSPTFIPTVHSNSHRKIIEMRRKGEDQFDTGMIHAVA